jgi:RiboL-PSP-HEPN
MRSSATHKGSPRPHRLPGLRKGYILPMNSPALKAFNHAIQDSTDLLKHFDSLNTKPPPADIEVLKRASLVMALAALETYFEDRIIEVVNAICTKVSIPDDIKNFYRSSLEIDLKSFHSPSTERVRLIFKKYLSLDISEAWKWNNCDPEKAKVELNRLVKKRGDIAHRSLRPANGEAQPKQHVVTRDDMRKHIHFISQVAHTTDEFLASKLNLTSA